MKKIYLTLIAVFFIASFSRAQSSKTAYSNGDNLLNLGIGLGSPFFGSAYTSSLPVNPTITYERGVSNAISVGGTLSYASSKFNNADNSLLSGFKESAFYIGVRGSYHFNQLLSTPQNVDLYGGVSFGYVDVSVSDNTGNVAVAGSGGGYGIFIGGKYYFQPKFGVYAELGYESLSYLNVGVAFKF